MTETQQAILWGGTACAVLDGTAATVQFRLMNIPPLRVWQSVASGLLGERAFGRGWTSGILGLLLHTVIAFTAAIVFVAASQRVPFLLRSYWVSGPLYGAAVFLVMNLIVVPLSARPKRPPSLQVMLIQVLIHIFFVGLPIALATNHFGFS